MKEPEAKHISLTGHHSLFARALSIAALCCVLFSLFFAAGASADTQEKSPWGPEEEFEDDWWNDCTMIYTYSGGTITVDTEEGMSGLLLGYCDAERVYLGKHVQYLDVDSCRIGAFYVDEENPWLTAVDGVVFSKDGTKLVLYPSGRKSTHYDVPAGTKVIGKYAFSDAVSLQSVSLPLGLQQLGWGAFMRTGLTSVTLPPTVKRVGPYAFSSCVNLAACSASPSVSWGEYAFNNCPLMDLTAFAGDEGGVVRKVDYMEGEEIDEQTGYIYEYISLDLVASPANTTDMVYLYDAPDGRKRLPDHSYRCGEVIYGNIQACDRLWYRMDISEYDTDESTGELIRIEKYGYLRRSEVTPCPADTLFTVQSVRPSGESIPVYISSEGGNGKESYPLNWYRATLRSQYGGDYSLSNFIYYLSDIGWCTVCYLDDGYPDAYADFRVTDAVITREYTGDHRTFGIVAASSPENRVNLRSTPSASGERIGRYFTGTQLEILEERAGWYRVRIGFTEGWMMKEYVRIVRQEKRAQ